MLFAIISQDVNDSLEKRLPVREQHLARLELLEKEGRLILAGPHPLSDSADSQSLGFSGSLVVAEFVDRQAAEKWADDDPYVAAGVYATVQIKPFLQVLPKPA